MWSRDLTVSRRSGSFCLRSLADVGSLPGPRATLFLGVRLKRYHMQIVINLETTTVMANKDTLKLIQLALVLTSALAPINGEGICGHGFGLNLPRRKPRELAIPKRRKKVHINRPLEANLAE